MHARAGQRRRPRPRPMPTRLDGGNRHQRLRETAVELAIPLHVAAEAGRHARAITSKRRPPCRRPRARGRSPRSSAARSPGRRSAAASRPGCAAACSNGDRQRVGRGRCRRLPMTWLTISIPKRASSCRASEPTATRAAVSRALARSSTSRMSSWPYLTTPARSAWPGRGRVTAGRSDRPVALCRLSASTCIVCCQFSQSLFGISSAIGAPVVTPWRTPESDLRPVRFDRHAAAAAVAALAAAQSRGERRSRRQAGGHAIEDDDRAPGRATRRR